MSVIPHLVDADHCIQFQCQPGVACWNVCCSAIDITLTPYDVLRLKRRLGLDSTEFLRRHTVPFELDKDDMAGVKLKPAAASSACPFMAAAGCQVYDDRPTACRYYPVALLSMRKQDEATDRDAYALVKEDHCLGHGSPRRISIADYRREQGLEQYDDLARGWRQLILKKKSAGPAIGKPSLASRQLFFMACHDIDRFREFVSTPGFGEVLVIDEAERQSWTDDVALLQFAFRFLRQTLFGEQTIPLNAEAAQARAERRARNREAGYVPLADAAADSAT